MAGEGRRRLPSPGAALRHAKRSAIFSWRYLTADLRAMPDFVIVGAARSGTTSLYRWLATHPDVTPAWKKEIHFFDEHYGRGMRWYRAHFPFRRRGQVTGEATPYLLFHPLAAARAAHDLPPSTRFIVLLREPSQRAISQYWFWRQWFRSELEGSEIESLEEGIAREPERMAAAEALVLRGERSHDHIWFSYLARGEYAGQLRRWFEAVGRERVLVVESERLNSDPAASAGVLGWLGLAPHPQPFPSLNAAVRLEEADPAVTAVMSRHFESHNRELFELIGHELWTDTVPTRGDGAAGG
jgi:hypothetical protein